MLMLLTPKKMVRIFLLTYTDLSGNEFSDIINEIDREMGDIAVAPLSEMVPVAAVIEIDLMDRMHNNICNVSIPNTGTKTPYMCYLISTFSFLFSIERYHRVILKYEERNCRDIAMLANLKELSKMSNNYPLNPLVDDPLENLQKIRMLLERRSRDTMFKIKEKYVRMLSI